MGAQRGWQLPGQCGEDGTVGPIRLGPGDLPAEHRDLMAENHDLRVFGRLAAAEQHQPAEDPDHDQVEQAKGHKPRSCRNQAILPNSRSQYLRRVLKRYRITTGRLPYRRHRFEVASFLGVDESYIWPDALDRDEVAVVSESEVVAVYPHRSEVPRDVWGHPFSAAEREIGVLVYSELFVSEDASINKTLTGMAAADGAG